MHSNSQSSFLRFVSRPSHFLAYLPNLGHLKQAGLSQSPQRPGCLLKVLHLILLS